MKTDFEIKIIMMAPARTMRRLSTGSLCLASTVSLMDKRGVF